MRSCRQLCLERHTLVACKGILNEVGDKLRTKIKIPSRVGAEYMKFLRQNVELMNPEKLDPKTCRDPNDLMVLGLVAPRAARAIVTGDRHLLVMEGFKGASFMTLTPRAFWQFSQSEA